MLKTDASLTPRERLNQVFALQAPDRTPILGGWIACPEYIMEFAGATEEEYWSDPIRINIKAYQNLRTDGLIHLYVPMTRQDYRIVNHETYQRANKGLTLEETITIIDTLPSPEKIEKDFQFEEEYAEFRNSLIDIQKKCGDMVWMPAQWNAGAKVTWYGDFGYENFFYIVGLYPKRAQKLMEIGGARGRCQSRLVAQAVKEGLYPHAMFFGEDICYQNGPMLSPDFMEKYYIPQLKYGLEPLLEVGCRPVWHCDGDVRLLLDMLLDAGVKGFQGFQPECGMRLEEIVKKRTKKGEKLLIFGPLSVTTELPVCSPEEITIKVHEAINICKDNAHLVLFTANTINPDIPIDNIRVMYEAVQELN